MLTKSHLEKTENGYVTGAGEFLGLGNGSDSFSSRAGLFQQPVDNFVSSSAAFISIIFIV